MVSIINGGIMAEEVQNVEVSPEEQIEKILGIGKKKKEPSASLPKEPSANVPTPGVKHTQRIMFRRRPQHYL